MSGRPPLRVLVAVGLVAGTTLALQVLLTRIFAAVLFYHFGFLIISLALLGVGGGAIAVYVRPGWFDRVALERVMARWSLLYAVLTLVAVPAIVRLDYGYPDGVTISFVANLALACALAGLPFLAAGVVVALAVRAYTASMGRLYAFDLAGASLGALLVVPAMWLVDVPTLAVLVAAIAAVAAALLAGSRGAERGGAAVVAGVAVLAAVAFASFFEIPADGRAAVAERWTPLARVLGFTPGPVAADSGADATARNGLVVYDRVLGEVIPHRRGRPVPGYRRTQTGPQSVGYALTGPGDALVIGGGGGRDILNALASGQRSVDVIELNRGIRDVVDKDLRFFSGAPYSLPRVHTRIGDGRSTLAESDTKYDQVHLGFTDTFSSSSGQAFALTENNLYTVEAVEQYLGHLKPRGVLNLTRPSRHFGEESLRATVLVLEALKRAGVKHPERNVVVIAGNYRAPFRAIPSGTVLARREPYTKAELARIRRLADQRGQGVVYAPGGPYRGAWAQLARAPSIDDFCTSYRLDVCAPTDDKPFFFQMKRLGDLGTQSSADELGVPDPLLILLVTLGILGVFSGIACLLPLALTSRAGRPSGGSLAFFAFIGMGFLLLEVVLIQRFVLFLGFPTYALSVVLFSLLLFTGLGSLLTTRLRAPRRDLTVALGVATVLVIVAAFGLQPLLRGLIEQSFALRLVLAGVLLAPLGLLLGVAMPIGLKRLAALYPGGVPWAWGVNGVTSVVASVLAVAIALMFGFTVTTLVGAACYLGALAHVRLGAWPDDDVVPEPEATRADRDAVHT